MSDKPPPWLRRSRSDQTEILLYVQPGAKVTAVVGEHMGKLKVKISAPPVDGAANEAVIEWMAEKLGIKSSKVRLLSGQKSRQKVISVEGLTLTEVKEKLLL